MIHIKVDRIYSRRYVSAPIQGMGCLRGLRHIFYIIKHSLVLGIAENLVMSIHFEIHDLAVYMLPSREAKHKFLTKWPSPMNDRFLRGNKKNPVHRNPKQVFGTYPVALSTREKEAYNSHN